MRNLLIITSIIFLTACSLPVKQADLNRISELVADGEVSKVVVMNQETLDVYLTKNMSKGPHLQYQIWSIEEVQDSLSVWYDKYELDYRLEVTGY